MTIFFLLIGFFTSLIITRLLVRLLPRLRVLDTPNERSNHALPTPRGGGLAIAFVCLPLLFSVLDITVSLAVLTLVIVSFIDDTRRNGLPAWFRLFVQIVAATAAVHSIDSPIFQGLFPDMLDSFLAVAALVAFTNFFNFMDGIDEISASEAVPICIGAVIVIHMLAETAIVPESYSASMILLLAAILSSVLGFWVWNRHPAKIFLGDVGSVFLGLMLGYFLLLLASYGAWSAAVILPAYYIVDAGFTMTRRLFEGKKIWQAHSEHAYQQAVRSGLSHSKVSRWIFMLNILLIIIAVSSHSYAAYGGKENIAIQFLHILIAYIAAAFLRWKFTCLTKADKAD